MERNKLRMSTDQTDDALDHTEIDLKLYESFLTNIGHVVKNGTFIGSAHLSHSASC